MLAPWLNSTRRNPRAYPHFEVCDVTHVGAAPDQIKDHLAQLLRDAAVDPDWLSDLAGRIGWQKVQDLVVKELAPTNKSMKRGDFGEVLISAVLEEQHGFTIPVRKLRFKTTSNQTLPATDTLALKLDENDRVIQACYVESKLRTVSDHRAVIDGCSQLAADYAARLPDIVKFIASRLYEARSKLYVPFSNYLKDRTENRDFDVFALSLCWDTAAWTEDHLQSLEDEEIELPGLTVHAIRLDGLRPLTDEVFARIGVTDISDDD